MTTLISKMAVVALAVILVCALLCSCAKTHESLNEDHTVMNDNTIIVEEGNETVKPLASENRYLYVNSNEGGGGFYQDRNEIYYANPNDLRKLYKYDTAKNTSALLVDDVIKVLYIRVYDDMIYFTGVSTAENHGEDFDAYRYAIFRVNKNGSDLEQLIDYAMNSIIVDDYMYYIDRPNDYDFAICRFNLKTREKEVIIDSQQRPYQINIVNDKIYYCKLDNTVMEYCISTQKSKELAYEEYGLERLQYFDGALYYHSCFVSGNSEAKTLVRRIDLITYENLVVFDFSELYNHPQSKDVKGITFNSLNVTTDKIFFAGTLRMADRKDNEFGAFVYDKVGGTLAQIGYNSDRELMAMCTYITDDAIFYFKSEDIDGEKSVTVLDYDGKDVSEKYSGLCAGVIE